MDPISERLLWFVLGFLSGALIAGGLVARRRRDRPSAPPVEPPAEPASLAPSAMSASGLPPAFDPPHVPGPARLVDVSAARAAGFNLKHAEDLTILEGIGPRTEELLRAHGVEGFAQLAGLDERELLDILDRGGPSFQFADPRQWPRQAALAAENRWKELKRLQDERIEGVRKPD